MIILKNHEDMKKLLKYAPGYSYSDPDNDVFILYAFRNQNWHALQCCASEYEYMTASYHTIELMEPIIGRR